jgi:hypothetical protein
MNGTACKALPDEFKDIFNLINNNSLKIQRCIIADYEKLKYDNLFENRDQDICARLLSVSGPMAGLWLRSLPYDGSFLADSRFSEAIRQLLGLPSHDELPLSCICGVNLREKQSHVRDCKDLSKRAHIPRHNEVVQILAKFARKAGCHVVVEPRLLEARGGRSSQQRPDLKIQGHAGTLLVDVTITNPLSDTYVRRAAREQGSAAAAKELRKRGKYGKYEHKESATSFLSFALELYGTFGKEATRVMEWLANEALDRYRIPDEVFINDLSSAISVGLQRANAVMEGEKVRFLRAMKQREVVRYVRNRHAGD